MQSSEKNFLFDFKMNVANSLISRNIIRKRSFLKTFLETKKRCQYCKNEGFGWWNIHFMSNLWTPFMLHKGEKLLQKIPPVNILTRNKYHSLAILARTCAVYWIKNWRKTVQFIKCTLFSSFWLTVKYKLRSESYLSDHRVINDPLNEMTRK